MLCLIGAVVRLCYEFKCVVSFGGGSLPLQVCDDCDPSGYSAVRSVKLRSLTFKGVVKSSHHGEHHHPDGAQEGVGTDSIANGVKGGTKENDSEDDYDSFDDMTSSESEPEDMEESSDHHYHPSREGGGGGSSNDDYNSVDSFSTAGESGTYATSSYSSYYSQNNPPPQPVVNPNSDSNSLVGGWIAIVHAKLAATKIARRMKRKLAVDMAKKANDNDLAKALPEAVDGCVSPHMNMIALLSYGGGGKGGSGYHLQVGRCVCLICIFKLYMFLDSSIY